MTPLVSKLTATIAAAPDAEAAARKVLEVVAEWLTAAGRHQISIMTDIGMDDAQIGAVSGSVALIRDRLRAAAREGGEHG